MYFFVWRINFIESEKICVKKEDRKRDIEREGGRGRTFIIDRINHHSDEFMRATY